jgi:hypothetical protein
VFNHVLHRSGHQAGGDGRIETPTPLASPTQMSVLRRLYDELLGA